MGLFTPSYLKKGIARFFEIIARDFGDLLKLNFFFIVSCIPIITIGPAITALSAVIVKRIRNKPCYVFHEYKNAFIENFKRSFPAGILVSLLTVLASFAAWYYGNMYTANGNLAFLALASVTLLMLVLLLCGSCYLYTMIALVDTKRNLVDVWLSPPYRTVFYHLVGAVGAYASFLPDDHLVDADFLFFYHQPYHQHEHMACSGESFYHEPRKQRRRR